MTKLFDGIVAERVCGNRKLGEEIHLTCDGKFVAQMADDSKESRELALFMTTLLNDAQSNGSRPSKLLIKDRGERYDDECKRNAEHIAKTIDLNMKMSQEKWEMVDHLWNRVTAPTARLADHHDALNNAIRWAAELYAIRSFVTGVIRGRLHKMAEGHIDSQVAKWEEQWDTAFGDLVGKVLHMQD